METRPLPKDRFSLFVILVSLTIIEMAISSLLLDHFSRMEGWSATFAEDSEGYLLVTRYFLGENIPDAFNTLVHYRLFSPLIPFVVSFLGKVLPLPSAFFLLNSLLWIATAYLFYLFAQGLLQSNSRALACSIIFTTSLPLMVWGLPIMVDMGAYFFVALILLLDQQCKKFNGAIIIGLVTALAILTKPTLVAILLFLIVYHGMKKEIGKTLVIAGISVTAVIIVYSCLSLELKDFFAYSSPRHQGIFYVLNSFFFCFHFGLILALWGWKELKEIRNFSLLFLLTTLSLYLPFVHNPRLLFIIYPAIIPLISVGADTISQGLANRYNWDKRFLFRLIISTLVVISNILTAFYLYVTRTLELRSIENLLKFLRILS
jgi:phage shock protein PspC (stress-responsive transcriptional regulator)